MRGNESTSDRKTSILIECRRQNVCCVEGGSGVELIDSLVNIEK